MTFGYADLDVDYIMKTFPIVKHRDEKQYGEYRTKRAMELPADAAVANVARERVDIHIYLGVKYDSNLAKRWVSLALAHANRLSQ